MRDQDAGMPTTIRTRDQLMRDLTAALAPGEPARLLVVFRFGGRPALDATTDLIVERVIGRVSEAGGPSALYYTPRRDELCALIAGGLLDAERTLCATVNDAHRSLASGVSLGFGTVVLPHEASDALGALELADSRIVGIEDGQPVARSVATGDARHALPRVA